MCSSDLWKGRGQLDSIIQLDTYTVPVWGQVSLWGRVIEAEFGYRATYAYPRGLMVMARDVALVPDLSRNYGVEVTVL